MRGIIPDYLNCYMQASRSKADDSNEGYCGAILYASKEGGVGVLQPLSKEEYDHKVVSSASCFCLHLNSSISFASKYLLIGVLLGHGLT